METLKSARFWITVLVLLILAGLTILGRISGDLVVGAAIVGVAAGWGLSDAKARTGANVARGILLLFAISFALSGCVTTGGHKELDLCRAHRIAVVGHQLAHGASAAACALVEDPEKRARCLRYQSSAASLGAAVVRTLGESARQCPKQ